MLISVSHNLHAVNRLCDFLCAGVNSHAHTTLVSLGVDGVVSWGAELMNVWLMVLTEMPYSSTSALRQSKKAWTACLEAASEIIVIIK